MSGEGLHKTGVIYMKDSEKGGAGDMVRQETYTRTPVPVQAESTVHHLVSRPATMETAVNKHQSISQQHCHNTPVGGEFSSGLFVNRLSESNERLSPANSTELFVSPGSSRSQSQESIVSGCWDKDRNWSALHTSPPATPLSFSRAFSSCSSVKSGMFTPTLVPIRKHTLESGSSLVHMQTTCYSPYGGSPSPCPQLPRHRLPPTRLSLLTAILRKGRLPILSPALTLQRPYSPCWPIHHGVSCNACTAASSVAPISLEGSPSRARSSASVHSAAQGHSHRDGGATEAPRVLDAPQSIETKELSTSWGKIGPHSPPLLHWSERQSNNGRLSERSTSHFNQGLLSSPIPPLSPPFPRNILRPVDYAKVPLPKVLSPPIYSSISRHVRYTSPDPLRCSELGSFSPEPEPVKNQVTRVPQDSNHPQKSSRVMNKSPESEDTLSTTYFRPKPMNKSFVQALNSHLQSKLSSLTSAPADNAQGTSRPQVTSMGVSNNRGTSIGTPKHCTTLKPQGSSPSPRSFLSEVDIKDVKPSSLSCCASKGHLSVPSQCLSGPVVSTQKHTDALCQSPLQNGLKGPPQSMQHLSFPQAYRSSRLSPILYAALGCPSPEPDTPPSTPPGRFTLSPSPAPPTRDLTVSPSLSSRSTPSPCLWREMSDSVDKRRKPHKIKSSYKCFAAIPTNNLLLDQQVIDEEVDIDRDSQDPVDTHELMCSPSELRQQSEELYTVIDEVLEDPISLRHTYPAPAYSRETLDTGGSKASFNVQQPVAVEKKLTDSYKTKPGIIRSANVIPRLPEEDDVKDFNSNPFNQYLDELTVYDRYKLDITALGATGADGNITAGNSALNTAKTSRENVPTESDDFSNYSLSITDSVEPIPKYSNDSSCQGGETHLNPVKIASPDIHLTSDNRLSFTQHTSTFATLGLFLHACSLTLLHGHCKANSFDLARQLSYCELDIENHNSDLIQWLT
ncbi:hypothetical protein DPEC_G00032880 [Dallia pectoralis]|uniref:Uncharacterized protein n=1 Tax=Dallia pectoralis TaxID=75939 RepID=A0ACC2HDH3_DALPE|nr:hypothetical protein DPEC_G00032880 [Dallia pectoralis]